MVTITYDPKQTSPRKLAGVIAELGYEVAEATVKEAPPESPFAAFPAPLPSDAPDGFADPFRSARAAGRPILIDFWAPWCAPCIQLEGTLTDPAVHEQLEGVEVLRVNLDEHPQLAEVYGVRSIPDVFFVDARGRVVDRLGAYEEPGPFIERLKRMKSAWETLATLGVSTGVPSEEAAESLALPHRVRVLGRAVTQVAPQGPADRAGLEVGDVLLRLGGNDLYSADDISDFLSVSKPGQQVNVAFKRPGSIEERETKVTLGGVDQASQTTPRLEWQFASLAQLPRALEQARAKKKKVLVGLSGAET